MGPGLRRGDTVKRCRRSGLRENRKSIPVPPTSLIFSPSRCRARGRDERSAGGDRVTWESFHVRPVQMACRGPETLGPGPHRHRGRAASVELTLPSANLAAGSEPVRIRGQVAGPIWIMCPKPRPRGEARASSICGLPALRQSPRRARVSRDATQQPRRPRGRPADWLASFPATP